ncbi:anti-sigma factor family protein [Enterovirga sp. CN4-39]|uniref:anti-sigma factor family protein n=1 Tax=Enterovirga sp. CN4-39 TaxID=3400910 RepID=UPI003C0EC464
MRCEDALGRLDAFVDGELPEAARSELALHVESCAECSQEVRALRRLHDRVAGARIPAPAGLRTAIQAGLAAEEARQAARRRNDWFSWHGARLRSVLGQAGTLAAACLLTAIITWSAAQRDFGAEQAVGDALNAHLRGVAQDSPVQVATSDTHQVKPWFAGRLEFSPPVKDLAEEGFPLVGGRVDVIGQERAAALVYRRRLHTITLLVRPRPNAPPSAPVLTRQKGFNILGWSKGGMAYWAVSDVSEADLFQLQALL